MKNFTLLFLLAGLVSSFSATAGTVSEQKAQTVALNFIRWNAPAYLSKTGLTAALQYTRTEKDGAADFYVFDLQPVNGFVIVTADDNLEPVIAWSTESNFRMDGDKVGIHDWMDEVAARIVTIKNLAIPADEHLTELWTAYETGRDPGLVTEKTTTVGPLMATTWDQHKEGSNTAPYFYNQFCPYNSTDAQHCVTGCVACAMAQIMKYWCYPLTGKGSYKYVDAPPTCSYNYGNQSANFGSTSYPWASMPNALTSSTTAAQDSVVSMLMYHAGVAVAMNYGDLKQGGSSSYVMEPGPDKPSAQTAYTTYFGYDTATLKAVQMSRYTNTAWIALIQSELSAGRPVQYQGVDSGVGGHSWVCDGFEANNMFHMNWGWGGYCNGYFSLSNLNPATYVFNSSQGALIGIQPPPGAVTGKVSGINEVGSTAISPISEILLYPNPSRNYLVLQYTDETETPVKVNIYNMAGQKVFNHETTPAHGLNLQSFNTEMFANGYYVLEIETAGLMQRRKFVVSK